jgi:hypothetical protein
VARFGITAWQGAEQSREEFRDDEGEVRGLASMWFKNNPRLTQCAIFREPFKGQRVLVANLVRMPDGEIRNVHHKGKNPLEAAQQTLVDMARYDRAHRDPTAPRIELPPWRR